VGAAAAGSAATAAARAGRVVRRQPAGGKKAPATATAMPAFSPPTPLLRGSGERRPLTPAAAGAEAEEALDTHTAEPVAGAAVQGPVAAAVAEPATATWPPGLAMWTSRRACQERRGLSP
jgi:hypothetical protein